MTGTPPTTEEPTFFGRVGETVRGIFDEISERSQRDGAYNYLIAIPGALLGFMLTQNMVGSWFGGGLLSQIAAFPLAISAGLASAVFMTQGFNAALEFAQKTFGDGPESKTPPREPVIAAEPAIEEVLECEVPSTPNLTLGTCKRDR